MTRSVRLWTVLVADQAAADLAEIADWTADQFGQSQAQRYAATIEDAISALRKGPSVFGVKRRDDILRGLMTLHVARNRRKGRHILLFRVVTEGERNIEVLRIVHDAMDIARHLPADED